MAWCLRAWSPSAALSPLSARQASLEAMLMTPASPVAIFAGKALAATLLLVGCEACCCLPSLCFFGTPLSVPIIAAVLLATIGMAAMAACSPRWWSVSGRAKLAASAAHAAAVDSFHRRGRRRTGGDGCERDYDQALACSSIRKYFRGAHLPRRTVFVPMNK